MRDYLLNLANKIVGLASGLIVSIILARSLSIELRGEFGFIVTSAGLAAIVSGFGVNHFFIYKFRQERNDAVLHNAVFVLFGQAVALTVATLALAVVGRNQTAVLTLGLMTALMLHQQLGAVMSAYNIRRRIKVGLFYSFARLAAFSTLLLTSTQELWLPTILAALAPLCAAGLHLSVVAWSRFERPPLGVFSETYRFSWLPMIITLLTVLNYNVDIVMLRTLGDGSDLGLYVVAAGVVTYMWMIPDAVKEVLVSRVVRTKDVYVTLVPLKMAVLASLLTVGIMAAAGPILVPLAFGQSYRDAYRLILTLSAGTPLVVYYKILGIPVLAEGRRVAYCVSLGAAAALNIALNLWAIPRFGAMGAAAVSAFTYTVTGGVFVSVFCSVFGVRVREVLFVSHKDVLTIQTILKGSAR